MKKLGLLCVIAFFAGAGAWAQQSAADFEISNGALIVYKGTNNATVDLRNAAMAALGLPQIGMISDNAFFKFVEGTTDTYEYSHKEITTLYLPEALISVGQNALMYMSITELSIPASVISWGYEACAQNYSLKKLTLPEGLDNIGNGFTHGVYAFVYSLSLESLTIPNSVKTLGMGAFYGCRMLKNLTLGSGLLAIPGNAFCGAWALDSVTIPDGIKEVGYLAFGQCTSLKKVTLGAGLETLECRAFDPASCLNLKEVHIRSAKPPTVYPDNGRVIDYPFAADCKVYVPRGTKALYYDTAYITRNIISIEEEAGEEQPSDVPVTSLTLSKTTLSLKRTYSEQLTAVVLPAAATNQAVLWSSEHSDIASVDSTTGLVTALKMGTTVITVQSVSNPSVKASCTVTVTAIIPVTSVTINPPTLALRAGETDQLTAQILPGEADVRTVTWTSSNTYIASVDNTGLVTAQAEGNAIIYATSDDTSNGASAFYGSCNVTVSNYAAVTSVLLDHETLNLAAPNGTATLTATILPSDATTKTVEWESNNPSVAVVTSTSNLQTTVRAISEGTAYITVTTTEGRKTASCKVNVTATTAVTGITLDSATLALEVGESWQLHATVLPTNASDKTVEWTSSNQNVAIVDANGLVRTFGEGLSLITARTTDGGHSATCIVTVTRNVAVTGISLSQTTLTLERGTMDILYATLTPSDATNKAVEWLFNNLLPGDSAVVSLTAMPGNSDLSRIVTAKAAGAALITARTADGGHSATCMVTVTTPTAAEPTIDPAADNNAAALPATVAPTATGLTITPTGSSSSPLHVSIYTVLGQPVYQSTLFGPQTLALDKGIYIVRLNNASVKAVVK